MSYLTGLLLTLFLSFVDGQEQNLARSKVALVSRADGSSSEVSGVLDLGRIRAGDAVEVVFDVENKTSKRLDIRGVRPSCSCIGVELPQLSLEADQTSTDPGKLNIRLPKGRGKSVIGGLALLDDSGATVGSFRVEGVLDRPLSLEHSNLLTSVSAEEKWTTNLRMYLDTSIDPSEVRISVVQDVLTASLTRKAPESDECVLQLTGSRKTLLENRRATVEVAYNNKEKNWSIRDTLTVDFFDGTKVRIIPANPTIKDSKICFLLYSVAGLDREITVSDDSGKKLDCEFKPRSKDIVDVKVSVPDGFSLNTILISNGVFEHRIRLASN